MSTPEFDKFDLEGLSLEDVEPTNPVKVEPSIDQLKNMSKDQLEAKLSDKIEEQIVIAEPVDQVVEPELMSITENADSADSQMVCPKCELEQNKAEQCAGCGVYVAKAKAQIGQSKIEITSVKF